MTFTSWVIDLFKDERGATSIKPVIALIGSMFLCGTMLANSLTSGQINPSENLVDAVMVITIIGMGADTVDKFSMTKQHKVDPQPENQPENQPLN